ncbi:MAG: hypothetical protein NDI84_00535 [Steroidobacteraceae bacterium]|nr:hypothetical protein [Steroidobacteraceae bacterium]
MKKLTMLAALLLAGAAVAHDDHIGPNGGYTKHLGAASVELVTDGAMVRVYVRDEKTEKSLDLTGAKGRAIVLAGGRTETVQLQAAGGVLAGAAKQPIPGDAKVAISLQIPGQASVPSSTFELARKATLATGTGR